MNNSKSKNSSSAGATNPVKTVSYRLPGRFLYWQQKLNKNQATYPTTIQAQNLTTNITQDKFTKYFWFRFNGRRVSLSGLLEQSFPD